MAAWIPRALPNSMRYCATWTATITIAATFAQVRKQLGAAKHPIHYLAIPPSLFGKVLEQLKSVGLRGRRAGYHREALWPRPGFGNRAERDRA